MRTRAVGSFVVGLVAVLSLTACHADIHKFEVLPLQCCSGEEVTIAWESEGDANTLSSFPAVSPPLGSVGKEGTEKRTVTETTEFKLDSKSGNHSDQEKLTVAVVPPGGMDFTLGTFGKCVGGVAEWRVVNSPSEWSGSLKVNIVTNNSGKEIVVSHDGVSQTLDSAGSAASTAAFAGKLVSGDWFMAPLLVAPSGCPLPGALESEDPPSLGTLSIVVNAVCQGGPLGSGDSRWRYVALPASSRYGAAPRIVGR